MEDIHPDTLRALHDVFGYNALTETQIAAIPPSLAGHDVFVRAPTGSGKTIAFLVPVLQALAGLGQTKGCGALVLSPSRELAHQTREQALKLLTFHEGVEACLVMGGTDAQKERNAVMSGSCQLLVATPGRLLDHLNNGMGEKLSGLRVLVLDEADRLLDMGFKPVIEEIASKLPPSTKRQTLLFTATVPDGVKDVAARFMRKTFKFVDVAPKQSAQGAKIDQRVVVVPPQRTLAALQRVLTAECKTKDHKVIVFVTTARMVSFVAAFLRSEGHTEAMELYGDMTQSQRNRVTQKFREGNGSVLVASDVVARGVDFPDVTCVIQLGIASSDEQYVHRIGRTGRAGKKGRAVAILGEDEIAAIPSAAKELKSYRSVGATAKSASLKTPGRGPASMNNLASRAFRASLGFYGSQAKRLGWKGSQLVDNVWARFAPMMESPPEIKDDLWKKLGCGAVCAKRWAALTGR